MGCCVDKCESKTEGETGVFELHTNDSKRLRVYPNSKSEYAPPCKQVRISPGTRVTLLGRQQFGMKYVLVKAHGITGFIRRRYLKHVPDVEGVARQRRELLVAMWCLMNKGVPNMCVVLSVTGVMPEAVPWWLLADHEEREPTHEAPSRPSEHDDEPPTHPYSHETHPFSVEGWDPSRSSLVIPLY